MTYRRAAAAAMFVAVLIVDTCTKLMASTTDLTWHPDPLHDPGRPSMLTNVAVVIGGLLVACVFQSVGFAVAMAGVVGNVGWALATGGTPNPIVDITGVYPGGAVDFVAFNVADVSIYGGGVWGAMEIAIWCALAVQSRRAILRAP